MAKFCGNCGAKMDDEDKVCGECGTPFSEEGGTTSTTSIPAINKLGNKNSIIKLAGAAIAAIIVLVIVISIIGNSTGYKGTINKMVKAYKNDDPELLMSISSYIVEDMAYDRYEEDAEDRIYDSYEDLISNMLDEFEDSVGNIKKITYEITDESDVSDRKTEKFKDGLEEVYNIDASDIKKIVIVRVKLTVKGAKKSSVFPETVCLIKEPGGWKILPGYDGSDF